MADGWPDNHRLLLGDRSEDEGERRGKDKRLVTSMWQRLSVKPGWRHWWCSGSRNSCQQLPWPLAPLRQFLGLCGHTMLAFPPQWCSPCPVGTKAESPWDKAPGRSLTSRPLPSLPTHSQIALLTCPAFPQHFDPLRGETGCFIYPQLGPAQRLFLGCGLFAATNVVCEGKKRCLLSAAPRLCSESGKQGLGETETLL